MAKTAAIFPAKGIGDALLMMVASHRLLQEGYRVTTHHSSLEELKTWFPGHLFSSDPLPHGNTDLIIVQNDNSPKIPTLKRAFQEKLSIFYPTYQRGKHLPLSLLDQVFDFSKPMAENIAFGIARLLRSHQVSKNNGLSPPEDLIYQKHKNQVIIHPTSSAEAKNWKKKSYIRLGLKLKKRGFTPIFALSPKEREEWIECEKYAIEMPLFETLADIAKAIYESGLLIGNDSLLGHLASNLHIPTLIIADNHERMKLWRPGWLMGEVVTPPAWIPKHFRQKHWKTLITVNKVLAKLP